MVGLFLSKKGGCHEKYICKKTQRRARIDGMWLGAVFVCITLLMQLFSQFFFGKSARGSDLLAAVSDDLAAIFGIHSLLFFKHSLNEIGTLLFQMLQIIVKCSHYPSAPFEQYSHFYERAQSLFRSYHLERRMTSRRCVSFVWVV